MTELLVRIFTKGNNTDDRYEFGRMAGMVGFAANLLLFIAKLLTGILSSSVAVIADSFNNLSDAGSSVVTLVGFRMASAPPDKEHPFGHGRMEYVTAMVIAVMILFAGFELGKSSVERILDPAKTAFGIVSLIILAAAILGKLWLARFFRNIGKRIRSRALLAAAADSRNDVICTGLVLVSGVVGWLTGIGLDGYIGVLVAGFVMWSGISVLRGTISPLLGQAPDAELVSDIKQTVLGHKGIIGIHDLMVHNYGPGNRIISLHAEVSSDEDVMLSHDLVDCIEREMVEKYNAVVCIHMDPVDTEDDRVKALQTLTEGILKEIDPSLTLHDFRVVFGETHTNMIFDVVVPFDYKKVKELCDDLQQRVWQTDPRLFTVATIEHSFT